MPLREQNRIKADTETEECTCETCVEPPAPPAGVPTCKAWCGRFAPEDMLSPCFHEPQDRNGRSLCCFCTNECGVAGRPLNPPPSAAHEAAAPASEPAVRPLSERMRIDREALRALLLKNVGRLLGGEIGTLARFGGHEEKVAALEADLTDEKAAHDMTRDAVKVAVDCENAARAEVEHLRVELADADHLSTIRGGALQDACAEVEQLRGKLAEAEKEAREWQEAAVGNEQTADERVLAAGDHATARVRSMREAAANVMERRYGKDCNAACIIRALPLDTGTERRAQADAIKAAVEKANNRAADAFHEWKLARGAFAPLNWKEFEAWLRSGEDAPGAVTPAKGGE